ncbi:hypothetical protein PRIPAC_83431 [Pristionchus pacificus]|uniref:Uncharacterized protein n=1 Tax=Pristionchus pacificus TaxID=54126 RepID=A0A2A6BTN1_PRIPA|nr:hypothetical protein PRIPAC_83431 [Pristionchus pacificus]|eukprot:PDM69342.1 hypothetical protein PRIPAC_47644 [Pristionchus pacificus]
MQGPVVQNGKKTFMEALDKIKEDYNRIEAQTVTFAMVKNCGVCGQRGNEHMRMFPSNSLPLKQELWMDRLNLLPEERHRLLEGFREGLNRNPPRRSPTTPNPAYTPNTAVTALPQLTRQNSTRKNKIQLSEVRVNDRSSIASPHQSNAQSASFPSPFRGNSASFPSPARIISETSTADYGMSTQHSDYTIRTDMYSSQETIEMDKDEDYRIPSSLPEYLLVSSSLLLSLFDRCPSCGLRSIESMDSFINGSALKLKWFCANCQEQSWSSQPRLKGRYYEGNVKLACSAHTTGLPLARFRDCADLIGLAIPSERTFHDLLVRLILPATDSIYSNHLQLASRGVDVSVDGRYDSPGYSASNCTVSFIDLQTNLLFMIVNMHKKEKGIDNVSGRMEKAGVRSGLMQIQALQMKIRSLCSDNDSKIGKMMREDPQLRDIKHLLDFWHLIKGINHDLRKISKLACCSNIKHWRRQIVNHAYYVHSKFGKSRQRGLMYWMSVLPHVTGRHANFRKVPFLRGIKKCMHSRLRPSNSHIIKRDSVEYQELKAVIMKPTFLAGFLRASPKKNTSPNENFNSIINMYAPKSKASSRRWYGERIKLATMHFNHLALLNLLNLREEKGSCSVDVIGRESKAVKR